MLETFVASAQFKALIQQHQDIPAVQKFSSILELASKDKSRDPLAGALLDLDNPHPTTSRTSGEPLSHRAIAALASYHTEHFPSLVPPSYVSYSKHTVGKVTFTTSVSSQHDCNIAYTTNNTQRVGIIRFIVAACEDIFLIVERYMPLPPDSAWNPFTSHANFGASLWAEKTEDHWEVVPVQKLKCHTISSRWADGVLLFKALNRVSSGSYFLRASN